MHMHQNIHVTNKIIHSTYVQTVITRKEDKRKNVKKKKTGTKVYVKSHSHCNFPSLQFAGNNYDTCNKSTL